MPRFRRRSREPAAAAVVAVAKSTPEGETAAVVAAAAPGLDAAGEGAAARKIPAELEGEYRARIVVDGAHVGAARVVDGPALARAGLRTLASIARAATVAKITAEVPFGDVISATGIAEGEDDLTVELKDGVATDALHEWVSSAESDPRAVVVELYDEEGGHSSTLKLKDTRVQEKELAADPDKPGAFNVSRLVLVPTEADWLVGAFEHLSEAAGLFSDPAAEATPPA